MNGVKCSASQFLLLYIKCVLYLLWFFLPLQVWALVFWGRCCLCQGVVGPMNLSTLCLSHLSAPCAVIAVLSSLARFLPLFPHSPFILFLLFFIFSFSSSSPSSSSSYPSLLFSPLPPCPPSAIPPLSSLPRRSHESLVVCLLEGIPTPPPPPLEPLSFRPLPRSLPFPSSLSSLSPFFFPPLFLMWKFWAIAGCLCGLVGMAFLEECLMLWLKSIPESPTPTPHQSHIHTTTL